jgi:hypothetical protein
VSILSIGLLVVSIFRGRIMLPLLLFFLPNALQLVFLGYLGEGNMQALSSLTAVAPVIAAGSFIGLIFTAVVPVDTFGKALR